MEEFKEMEEEWKEIEGHENYYVSSLGRVHNRNTCKFLQCEHSGGYHTCTLMQNKKKCAFTDW